MVFLLGIGTSNALAEKTPYAVFDNATKTLTFKYEEKETLGTNEYKLNRGTNFPAWCDLHKSEITKAVFAPSFAEARPTTCAYWFGSCKKLRNIEGIEFLNTEKVKDMRGMFYECICLENLDLSKFDTKNVTNMRNMFYNCQKLKTLDLSSFETDMVTNMESMFYNCILLNTLKLTNKFNTQNVEDMCSMFNSCKELKTINLSGFDTQNVEDMRYMFNLCKSLESLDLSNFNTQKVTLMDNMFNQCLQLTSLDLSNFDTQKVTKMNNMFYYCTGLKTVDISNFNTQAVKNMDSMFRYCTNLATIYVGENFVTTNARSSDNMFDNCQLLKGALPEYNANKTDRRFANYKTGYFSKLVGKNGNDKIGAAGEPLAAYNLALDDNKDFVAYEPFAAKAASYSRTINTGKTGTTWATLCLPFEVSLEGQNFRAFNLLSANETTNTIELEEITTSIPAGTPVIIKMNDGETQLNFTVADKEIANEVKTAATADGNYQLQGLYTQKEFSKDADNNCYIVKGDKLMNPAKLLVNTSTTQVGSKPFRAYMVDNSTTPAAGAKMFSIGFDNDGTTAIDSLNTIADDNATYYDLQGKRLNEPQKGINIVKRNGKTMKVIIK
ncbi:BspA family leucine-rich repeat surface protein [Prevotella sp.]|uniref:BspA family leucine-rich repeat surface protein n=1 Tax=Prevotella sp. TaxID=59823 RepID=UPI002E78867D|nr:BspA family leucine-rich repeat surface protein [Prevotella sp.]MEE0671268.1 BspA family leucine-rich repeat surface protein [Prevotella sp.]